MTSDTMPARARGWRAFSIVTYALLLTMAGATLASPLYPIYQDAWGLAPSGITIAYTAYMAGALVALTSFGRLSDHYGAIRVLRVAGLLMITSLIVSAIAPNLVTLSISRFFIGVTAGTTIPAATIGLIEAEPDRPRRIAPFVSSLTQMLGLGSGPLLGGILAQFLPAPLLLPYIVFILSTALGVGLLFTLPVGPRRAGFYMPHPRFQLPPVETRLVFAVTSMIAFVGFSVVALFTALTPNFARSLLSWYGPLIGGAGVAVVFASAILSQIVLRNISARNGLIASMLLIAVAMLALAAGLTLGSLPLSLFAVVAGGAGQGLALMTGVATVTAISPPDTRAGVVSAYFTCGYLGSILPLLVTGFFADLIGLETAVSILAGVTFLASAVLATLAWRMRTKP